MWLLAADDPANKQSHDQSLVANRNRDRALLTSSLAFCARSQVFLEAFWLEGQPIEPLQSSWTPEAAWRPHHVSASQFTIFVIEFNSSAKQSGV
ncbi:MAG: hypothetical protein FRX49_09662 [Trebouxia sp. A1-2]|nr:MAG: hypothetical protein FRX49_09662 [Trebouxia sp. A1-2]